MIRAPRRSAPNLLPRVAPTIAGPFRPVKMLIWVGRRYVQSINHRYGRTGTLWDCRYKSSLVQPETYLLLCHPRYIELNPVRAGMVGDPADYYWSSYRANAVGAPDPLLSPRPLHVTLGSDDDTRRGAYRQLFNAALDEKPLNDLRLALNQDQPIGNDRFYSGRGACGRLIG